MRKSLAVVIVFAVMGSFMAASWYASGATPIKPLSYVPPRMIINLPSNHACDALVQQMGINNGSEKTVPVDMYLNFKHALESCGGSLSMEESGK
jgi:hypothetical protein